jgi:hypothetical protein
MINLEELNLHFGNVFEPIIDGYNLEMNIIKPMTKLNKFIFNIRSAIRRYDQVGLPTNKYIQDTFKNFPHNNQIISYVGFLSKSKLFHYHIYSHPYTWITYDNITNNFPGGLFKSVRKIVLHDEQPFEYEFFLQIAQSFPLIEKLILINHEAQQNAYPQDSIITYSHLIELDLTESDETYVEQFLNDSKTCLLNDVYLRVSYNLLQNVTDNFTKDATRINCSKIIGLVLDDKPEVVKLKDYFPHAEIY